MNPCGQSLNIAYQYLILAKHISFKLVLFLLQWCLPLVLLVKFSLLSLQTEGVPCVNPCKQCMKLTSIFGEPDVLISLLFGFVLRCVCMSWSLWVFWQKALWRVIFLCLKRVLVISKPQVIVTTWAVAHNDKISPGNVMGTLQTNSFRKEMLPSSLKESCLFFPWLHSGQILVVWSWWETCFSCYHWLLHPNLWYCNAVSPFHRMLSRGCEGWGGGIICPYCSPAWSGFAFGIGHIHGDLSLVVRCVRSSGDGPPAPVV